MIVPYISWIHALILGIVQGATEFLPVSSTAHMDILPQLLRWGDPGAAFSAIVQLGPIAAIIGYFRKDLLRYIAGIGRTFKTGQLFPKDDLDARLGWLTIIGTLPFVIAGAILKHKVETVFRSLDYVGAALIILAIVLLIAERIGKRINTLDKLTLPQAFYIGLSQALALIPGASRSGCTITSGLFFNLDREAAARFSFLLSIPAITLAGAYQLVKVLNGTHLSLHVVGPYLFAMLIAGVVAYIVVNWLLGYLSQAEHTTLPFIIYRIVLGIAILALFHSGMIVSPQAETKTAANLRYNVGIDMASRR